jgi:hypothetical protein
MTLTDRDVERLASRLGEDAGNRLDVEAVGTQVLRRLSGAGGTANVRSIPRWLAAAAAIALLAGAGFLTFGTQGTPPGADRAVGLTPSLLDLSATELWTVLDSLEAPGHTYVLSDPSLDDLDRDQLETLLSMMEG